MSKLTVDELIARKKQSESDKFAAVPFHVKAVDGEIMFAKKSLSKVLDMMDGMTDTDSAIENYKLFRELIYEHCQVLHNPELQRAYECTEPIDIVDKIFGEDLGNITEAAEAILGFYGLTDEDTSKNDYQKEKEIIKN